LSGTNHLDDARAELLHKRINELGKEQFERLGASELADHKCGPLTTAGDWCRISGVSVPL
jgi:hypothetical protein